jgi:RNA recognition motif-containing protein
VSKRIYVGNLPFTASEEEVRQMFSAHGEVISVSLPNDRDTGRPRGFGFVEMADDDADKAIEALDGKSMGGRALRVSEAREREAPRRDFGGGRGGGGGYGRR